ncbi:hypothetical protein BBJ28_00002272 [Nothophytophthora sp. Chile5]|nr:hypothetical protein BBJ28_00002272 [Nothophytophthora sp. Chile5]
MGQPDPALPTFSWEQVQSHANSSNANKKTWVVFKHGVYDITDFASTHPGGDKVMQAAGKSIELFYQQSEPHTRAGVPKTLEELRIGNLRDQDVLMLEEAKRIAQSQSSSTGVDRSIAAASPPLEQFFFVESASPSPVPSVEAGAFGLKIIDLRGLQGEEAVSLSLTDLKTRFKQHSVITTIRCSTSRTSDGSITSSRVPAKWTGVLLADVLASVGLTTAEDIQQIRFEALDTDAQGRAFGSSIPATTALNAENGVLLAFEMDGAPIPREHGFPLRVIVPGTTGSKNVKFVHRIIVG